MQANAEVTLKKVTVAGNSRTSLSLFDAEFNDLKKSGVTLQETVNGLHEKTQQLLSTDMFEAVDTNLVIVSQQNGKILADVNVNVKEKGIPFLNVASYVKAGASAEAGFEVRGALRNPIGYGETFRLSNVTTQTGAREYQAAVSIPNVGPQRFNLNITARSATEDQSYYTSFKQQVDGVAVELNTRDGTHQLVAEYALRDEVPITGAPSSATAPTARDEKALPGFNIFNIPTLSASAVTTNTAMTSLKTSLKYLCTALDTRDNMASPSAGSYLQGSVEIAAPPGTAQFLRTDVTAQHHQPLGPPLMGQPGLVASVCGSLGMLWPILAGARSAEGAAAEGKDAQARHGVTHLCDRYQLGGANSLRGFDVCGTGPRAYRPNQVSLSAGADIPGAGATSAGAPVVSTDSLGGDLRAALLATLSVPVPVPFLAKSQMRAFVFANAGVLSNVTAASSGAPVFHPGAVRASVGGGFSIVAAGAIRLEATYAVPVLSAPQDQHKSFQLGVGMTVN